MSLIPNISSPIFSTSAFTIGLLLCDGLTPAEQNALGSWFMLLGQTITTSASQQQLLNNRKGTSTSYNSHIVNDNNLVNSANNIKQELNNIFKN